MGYIETNQDDIRFSDIFYTVADVERAIYLANQNSVAIVYPVDTLEELEELWDRFNLMTNKFQRVSDWISEEVFGISNQTHYEYLKAKFYKDDIEREIIEDGTEGITESSNGTSSEFKKLVSELSTPKKLYNWMKDNIQYKETDHLQSAFETFSNRFGDCHDQALFSYYILKKHGYICYRYFLLEYNEWMEPSGVTHTICCYFDKKWYWIENAWDKMSGINGPYIEGPALIDLWYDVKKSWKFTGNNDKLYIGEVHKVKPGMSLDEYVSACMPKKEPKGVFHKGDKIICTMNELLECKSFFTEHLITMVENQEPAIDIARTIFNMRKSCKTFYEESILKNVISDISDIYSFEHIDYSPDFGIRDYPSVTPEEMINDGIFQSNPEYNCFGVEGDNSVVDEDTRRQWFKEYKELWEMYKAIPLENAISRIRWIREYSVKMNNSASDKEINAAKQSILELGWNPNIPFSENMRSSIDAACKITDKTFGQKIDFIDLRNIAISEEAINESRLNKNIHPIFIVYGYKKNKIEFVGYSFDTSLTNVYIPKIPMVGIGRMENKSIKDFSDKSLSIFVTGIFVGDESYKKAIHRCDDMVNNFTEYTLRFRFLKERMDKSYHYLEDMPKIMHIYTYSLISIFGISISDKDLEEIYDTAVFSGSPNGKKLFIFYRDLISKYNGKKVNKYIDRLLSRGLVKSTISESFLENSDEIFIEAFCEENIQRDSIMNEVWNVFVNPISTALKIEDTVITSEGFEISTNLDEFHQILNEALNEGDKDGKIPFFVVLFKGKAPYSPLIGKFTGSEFSHASVSFDRNLNTMYSFAKNIDKNGQPQNGFIKESIKHYRDKDIKIGIYCLFVDNIAIKKMHKFVDDIARSAENTKYYIVGLFRFLFNLPKEYDFRMICSQFCDKVLKQAGIDITRNSASALVSPASFEKAAKQIGAKIYELFIGPARKYKFSAVSKKIDHLQSDDNVDVFISEK